MAKFCYTSGHILTEFVLERRFTVSFQVSPFVRNLRVLLRRIEVL
jgi:hypothetical protein